MYDELNRMIEEEIARSGSGFSLKLIALEKFQKAVENVRSNDPESIAILREETKGLCRWWPEYVALLVSSLCIPIGEDVALDGIHKLEE